MKTLSATPLLITVLVDTPLFTERVLLNGQNYTLRFDYSEREGRFYLDILDDSGDAIVCGIKLVENWELLRKVSDSRRPPGELYAWDSTRTGPPDLRDLGRRVRLIYYPTVDVSSTSSGQASGG